MTTLITPKILEPLGFGKHDAVVLSYIINMKETISRNIEYACKLRQPEVCLSLGKLVDEGFVTFKKENKKGKGRPVHIYKIKSNILEMLSDKLMQRQQELEADLKKLNEISTILKQRQNEQLFKVNA